MIEKSQQKRIQIVTRPVFKVRGRVSSKSVMLMTVDDDPHASNPSLKRQAIKKAADLAETGINLQVLPLEAGSVTNAIIFYMLFTIRDECKSVLLT